MFDIYRILFPPSPWFYALLIQLSIWWLAPALAQLLVSFYPIWTFKVPFEFGQLAQMWYKYFLALNFHMSKSLISEKSTKPWTYHSFFRKYNLGPSLKIEYLESGWEYQITSFIGLKFGISRITRLWFQVFKWLHLWMVWIWKSGFECKFPAPEGIMKNTKKHPTLPDHCDPTTCSKLDYKVPMERGYPYLSFGTFGSKLGSLLWPHWTLIQPEANHKMKNHGVISPYPLEVPG